MRRVNGGESLPCPPPLPPQVHGLLQDASALQAISWPPELHIAKTLARASAQTFLQSKRSTCLVTRLKIQYSSPEAEVRAGGRGSLRLGRQGRQHGGQLQGVQCCVASEPITLKTAPCSAGLSLSAELAALMPCCPPLLLQAFPNTLLAQGAAGAVTMFNGMIGVLLPDRNPITQQVRGHAAKGRSWVRQRGQVGPCPLHRCQPVKHGSKVQG